MLFKKALVIILFTLSSLLYADDEVHLNLGGGLHASTYQSAGAPLPGGYGLNFKTDLGYYFSKRWAVEWSSHVKFTQVSDFFVWDTIMTFGLRYQLPHTDNYLRVYAGRSPSVFFLNDAPQVTRETNASRLQLNGPVYGLAFGKMYKTETYTEWFLETAVTYQSLEEETGIRNDGDVPVEVYNRKPENNINVISIYTMIGIRVF